MASEITQFIETLLSGQDLTLDQSRQLLDTIFDGEVTEIQTAAFLTAMRAKGPKPAELAGLAKSLRQHAVKINVGIDNLVDTCGTGGAAVKTFNISTAAALVAAGAGVHIAKHGNRAITSNSGSADVLAQLGVKIDASVQTIVQCIKHANIGFMFAPMFHPAMKYVQPVRKALGFRTVFNILGPLANPAGASAQVLGVGDEKLLQIVAQTLKLLGVRYAMVIHSRGLDEISISGITEIAELSNGRIETKQLNPADLGIALANLDQLKVTDAKQSADLIKEIISGRLTGPHKDIVVLNAAAAISNGSALTCLNKLVEISNK
jgi:anthranilate phosphoribosyltransferase